MKVDRSFAHEMDALDPLAPFRDKYFSADEDVVYLDGNSLGRLPTETVALMELQIKHNWGTRLIRAWNESWMELPSRLGKKLAPLIGASPEEILFGDSTSTNLFKLAQAGMNFQSSRTEIVSDTLNFPSDLYILQGVAENHSKGGELILAESEDGIHGPLDQIKKRLSSKTALLSLSLVAFKSAYLYPLAELTRAAHDAGALVIWDLSHAAGAVEIDLHGADVDMAVGCSYKYLNGGPGAPAYLYVRKDLQEQLNPVIQGWFGDQNPFSFDLDYQPASGVRRFNIGTPPIMSMAAIEPGLDILAQAGMRAVRHKSVSLQDYMMFLVENRLSEAGFSWGSPENAKDRGSHLTLNHEKAGSICQALINPPADKTPVIPDFRAPNSIRFGIAPLYVSYGDIWTSIDRLVEIIQEKEYNKFPLQPAGVT